MRRLSLILALAMTLPFAACGIARQDTNEPLDATKVERLRPGTTTAREVVELLGAPTNVVQLGRRSAYLYDATTAKTAVLILVLVNMGNQDSRQDRVWVFFDEEDVLTHYGATFGVHRTQYALPWEDVHEPEDNAARDSDRPGVSGQ